MSIKRIGRQSEQLMNDELYKIFHLLKHLDDVPIGQTPPQAKYNNALWINSKNNMLYRYSTEQYDWIPMFREKFQLLDQLLNKGEPLGPQYGQLWLNNEILMYFNGEEFRPIKTILANDNEIDMSFFNNFLMIPELKTIGDTGKDTKQYLIPSKEWDRVFLDGSHDDNYETIHHSCIQYPKEMTKNASLVHVNPTKLRGIKKRFFKIDKTSGGLDINMKDNEIYAFKAPEVIEPGKPVGGTLLKKHEDYKLITNDFEYDKPEELQSTISLSIDVLDAYDYVLVIEYEFDEFNTRGTVRKFSDIDPELYRGYQIVPLLYPFNVFLDQENLNETSFKYNNLDRVIFVDDIDKPFYRDDDGSTILFGEVYEGQKIVSLEEHILKLYGQTLEDRKHDLINLPPLDDFGNLKPKELIETYGKHTESNQAMIKDIIKNAEMAVMSADHKDVGIIQKLIEQNSYISGLITLRNHYRDPIIFLNGQALYEPLGDFVRDGSSVRIPRTHLGATYAVIDGAEDSKTKILAHGVIGDEYTYADVVKDTIFKDKEKLVLIGELFEESGKLEFKNGNLYIQGIAHELETVLPEIPRVEVGPVELAVYKNGDLAVEDLIEHDAYEEYTDEDGNVLYNPQINDEYFLKIPYDIMDIDEKIIVFINGLLVSKKDVYKDSSGNIYIENIKKDQTYMIMQYNENILFDFEMKPAISFSSSFSENLIYMNDKIICNSESILRDRLDLGAAVHNEIQQCKKNYEEDGVFYKADKIYICDKFNKRWKELDPEEKLVVEDIACQYDNAISSITTYIEDFKNATAYLYDYADAKTSSLLVGGITLDGNKTALLVKPTKGLDVLDLDTLAEDELIYDLYKGTLYIFKEGELIDIASSESYEDVGDDTLFLMGDILYAQSGDSMVPILSVENSNLILSLEHSVYTNEEKKGFTLADDLDSRLNLPEILSAKYGDQSYAYLQTERNANTYIGVDGRLMSLDGGETATERLTVTLPPSHYYEPGKNAISVYLSGIRQFDIEESHSGQEFSIAEEYKGDVVFIIDKLQARKRYSKVRIKTNEIDPIDGMRNAFEVNNTKNLYPGHATIFIDGIRQDRNAFKIIDKKVIQFLGEGIAMNEDGTLKSKILIEITDNYNIREVGVVIDTKKHLVNNNLCVLDIGDSRDLPLNIMSARDALIIYINGVLYTSHNLDNGSTIDRTNKQLIMTDAPIVQRLRDGDIVTVEWR